MLRREELNQIDLGVVSSIASEQIDIRISVLVDAGLVREETNALSANQLYAITKQHRYPRRDLPFRQLVRRVGLLVDYHAGAA